MKRQPKIHIQATNFTVQLEKKKLLPDRPICWYAYSYIRTGYLILRESCPCPSHESTDGDKTYRPTLS